MPTEIETQVMQLLAAIEMSPNVAQYIQGLGNEAVTVICEAALGSYPSLRFKARTNAVAIVAQMTHPQAREALPLLIGDASPDVAIRAIRAAGWQRNERVLDKIGNVLRRVDSPPLLAAEAVNALLQIDTPAARQQLANYRGATASQFPHRGSAAVEFSLRPPPEG